MPKPRPIAKRDIEIGRRLRLIRKAEKCSRSYLAMKSGVHHQAIVRIEIGRTPLKYGQAKKLLWALNCNPAWLATGQGFPKLSILLPEASALDVREDACFSDVFERHLASLFDSPKSVDVLAESAPEMRFACAAELREMIDEWFCEVPDKHVIDFDTGIKTHAESLLDKWPKDSVKKTLVRRIWFKKLAGIRQRIEYPENQKAALDSVHASVNSADVQPQWPLLKKRLQKATEPIGLKSKLAAFLGVKLASVSQWLSDSDSQREPGAETTLQMLKWVEHQERKT